MIFCGHVSVRVYVCSCMCESVYVGGLILCVHACVCSCARESRPTCVTQFVSYRLGIEERRRFTVTYKSGCRKRYDKL